MIGVVEGVQGIRWYEVTVTGQDAHTGTTPMPLRRNALLGTARLIERIDAIAREHALALGDDGLALGEIGSTAGRLCERSRARCRQEEGGDVGQAVDGRAPIGRGRVRDRDTDRRLRHAADEQVEMLEPLLVEGADAQVDAAERGRNADRVGAVLEDRAAMRPQRPSRR